MDFNSDLKALAKEGYMMLIYFGFLSTSASTRQRWRLTTQKTRIRFTLRALLLSVHSIFFEALLTMAQPALASEPCLVD